MTHPGPVPPGGVGAYVELSSGTTSRMRLRPATPELRAKLDDAVHTTTADLVAGHREPQAMADTPRPDPGLAPAEGIEAAGNPEPVVLDSWDAWRCKACGVCNERPRHVAATRCIGPFVPVRVTVTRRVYG